jgi:hypothetical protein
LRFRWSLVVAVFVVLLAGLALWLARPKKVAWPQPPTPNSYLEFLLLGGELNRSGWQPPQSTQGTSNTAPEPPPADLVARLREAIDRPGAVPTQPDMNYVTRHLSELALLKHLSGALVAHAETRLRAGSTNEAAEIGLDLIRFAATTSRHGLLIDHFVGLSIERRGISILRGNADGLSADTLSRVLRALEDLDVGLSDLSSTVELETEFIQRNAPVVLRFVFGFQKLTGRSPLKQAHAQFQAKAQSGIVDRRTLMLTLAAELHRRENGVYPKSLDDVVPRYLKTAPLDPVSGQPIRLPPASGRVIHGIESAP